MARYPYGCTLCSDFTLREVWSPIRWNLKMFLDHHPRLASMGGVLALLVVTIT